MTVERRLELARIATHGKLSSDRVVRIWAERLDEAVLEMFEDDAKGAKRELKLLSALRTIASLGGNLCDERLTDYTGANDARARGLMYTEARRLAVEAVKDNESSSEVSECGGSGMKIKHEGKFIHRLKPTADNPLEAIYAREWKELNDPVQHRPHGTLEYLVSVNQMHVDPVSQNDATVAATVIQWLGSPMGQCFVRDVLEEGGFTVTDGRIKGK